MHSNNFLSEDFQILAKKQKVHIVHTHHTLDHPMYVHVLPLKLVIEFMINNHLSLRASIPVYRAYMLYQSWCYCVHVQEFTVT